MQFRCEDPSGNAQHQLSQMQQAAPAVLGGSLGYCEVRLRERRVQSMKRRRSADLDFWPPHTQPGVQVKGVKRVRGSSKQEKVQFCKH